MILLLIGGIVLSICFTGFLGFGLYVIDDYKSGHTRHREPIFGGD